LLKILNGDTQCIAQLFCYAFVGDNGVNHIADGESPFSFLICLIGSVISILKAFLILQSYKIS